MEPIVLAIVLSGLTFIIGALARGVARIVGFVLVGMLTLMAVPLLREGVMGFFNLADTPNSAAGEVVEPLPEGQTGVREAPTTAPPVTQTPAPSPTPTSRPATSSTPRPPVAPTTAPIQGGW